MVGWKHVSDASPSITHHWLTERERKGNISQIITQNVDRLHQRAGSEKVIDLHGRMDQVVCLDCEKITSRASLQNRLEQLNPELKSFVAEVLPDGDADIDNYDFTKVKTPNCETCGGRLKPDVVFFGDNVPKPRVSKAMQYLEDSDGLLVLGSSLQVYSGYRFYKRATELGMPIACVNLGQTRAENRFTFQIKCDCDQVFSQLV